MTSKMLVAYGSERGSTRRIAEAIGRELEDMGLEVEVASAHDVRDIESYRAVILGGALYAGRWHRHARGFASRFQPQLTERPVWLFSSGPFDGSASEHEIPPVPYVAELMRMIGAREHATFAGWLEPDTKGVIARAMARKLEGDHRDWARIRAWAHRVGEEVPARA